MKRFTAACAALCLGLAAAASLAHEGHDHGAEPPPAPAAELGPRLAAHSADFELVAALDGRQLVVWLDRWADNAPVTDAVVEVDGPGLQGALALRPDGAYALPAPALGPGEHPLTFSIETPGGGDLLNGVLVVPSPTAPATTATSVTGVAIVALAALLAVAAGFAWLRRGRRS